MESIQKCLMNGSYQPIPLLEKMIRINHHNGKIWDFNHLFGISLEWYVHQELEKNGFPIFSPKHPSFHTLLPMVDKNNQAIGMHENYSMIYTLNSEVLTVSRTSNDKVESWEYDCLVTDGREAALIEVKFCNMKGDAAKRQRNSPLKKIERRLEGINHFFPNISYMAAMNKDYYYHIQALFPERLHFFSSLNHAIVLPVTTSDRYKMFKWARQVPGIKFNPSEKYDYSSQ